MKTRAIILLFTILGVVVGSAGAAFGGEYLQMAGLIDTRTTFSDGAMSVEAQADLAHGRGFDALFITDHDILAMAYGLPPFRHVFQVKKQKNALRISGPEAYLTAIAAAQHKYPDLLLVPGSESVPYYYWSGSYFSGDLTANDHEKRLLAIGLTAPSDYEDMPVIHNRMSTRYLKARLPFILIFSGALLLGVYIATWGGWYRWAGLGVGAVALLMIINTNPFASAPYDQYMGNQGIAPYQYYIDYVSARGGMTFWNYPETRSGVRAYGPIQLNTPSYPEVLLQARDYTGFAAVYGDTITVTEPGRQWDQVLAQYCRGTRSRPVWGIATADFHEDGGAGERLGNYPTVFLVREKTRAELLSAMRAGRMYAVQGSYPQRLVLDDFSVTGSGGGPHGTLGEDIAVQGSPQIQIALSLKQPGAGTVSVTVIRDGTVVETLSGPLPLAAAITDEACPRGEKTYYRLMANGHGAGVVVANPVFVTVR
ncbi:MAG: hypothetical protein ABIL58_03780 [Pseudomonadota bacterium]